jgi:Tfp pilus assembly protein PilE
MARYPVCFLRQRESVRGVSLLELLLLLVIASVLIAAATLFYRQEQENAKFSQAVGQILKIRNAAETYLVNNGVTANSTAQSNTADLSISTLSLLGLLTTAGGNSPWNSWQQKRNEPDVAVFMQPNMTTSYVIQMGVSARAAALANKGCSVLNTIVSDSVNAGSDCDKLKQALQRATLPDGVCGKLKNALQQTTLSGSATFTCSNQDSGFLTVQVNLPQ